MVTMKAGLIFLCLIGLKINHQAKSEETPVANQPSSKKQPVDDKPSMFFSVSLSSLKQNTSADELLWIDVDEHQHLILKHQTNGRKQRGNVLLLHTQGENADHIRLIQPLSKQLTQLGWNIFIPNIARENFPSDSFEQNKTSKGNGNAAKQLSDIPTLESPDTAAQKNDNNVQPALNSENSAFQSSRSYQDYYITLCQSILDQTELNKRPYIIIANQNAAYWSLACLNMLDDSTPIIFLHPQLPKGVVDNLAELFVKQTHSIFSFHTNIIGKDTFSKTFKKQLWHSKLQRFNIGMLAPSKLQLENTVVARSITGWIDKQRKK